ncbi:hypothetical protein [Candidatus Mesenet endosymbiont of Agriotes lineatus]|uniref:hypothetical protein n=1 Tax=Candidatus Mesenet endosymbiont of Agriotes lineatus TaxID=3077948 RepID=UPI0030D52E9A
MINFLQEQKRYRILWWGIGGSLFDHLCNTLDFDAKYLLQNKESEEAKSQCQALLRAYGEMPVYWWWPWSRKIKDISLNESHIKKAKNYMLYRPWYRFILSIFTSVSLNFYLIKWHKLSYQGDEVVKKHKIGRTKNINDLSHIHFLNQETQVSDDTDVVLEEGITFSFGKTEGSIMQLSLKEALELFGLPKLLERLDSGLYSMRSHQMRKQDCEKYFSEEVNKKFKKLSLAYHPDKVADSCAEDKRRATEMQQGVNNTWQIMKNLYEHATSNHASVFNRDFQYSFYADVEIGLLFNEQKLDQLNDKILKKLWWISKVSHTYLTDLLNKFLLASKSTMEKHLLDEKKDFQSLEWNIESKVLKAVDEYIERYKEFAEELAKLYKDCQDDEDLKYIKPSVGKLLQRCQLQSEILSSAREFFEKKNGYIFSYSINPKPYSLAERENYEKVDEYFTLPVVEYLNILFISKELAKKAEKESKRWFKSSKKQSSQTEVASEAKEEAQLSDEKTSKEIVLEKMQELPRQELHELCYYLMSYHCYNMNEKNLFDLLKGRFAVTSINKKETEELASELVHQYNFRLISEFTPQRTQNDALADYERLAKRAKEVLKEIQEIQERTHEDFKKMREQLDKQQEHLDKQSEQLDKQQEHLDKQSEQLEQLDKNDKERKKQAQGLKQELDNVEQVLKQFIEEKGLHITVEGDQTHEPNPALEEASINGEKRIDTTLINK